jgi:3',5'-cyclic AMP phosphodiesterase CpdA
MTTIVHLSDLHFGPKLVDHLADVILEELKAANPDLLVVSGDWTMRGRVSEYERAREYLLKLPKPLLTIPGNHDQPLHLAGVYERMTRPWARYQTFINRDTDTVYQGNGLFVIGLLDSHQIVPGGIWSRKQQLWIESQLKAAPADVTKVLVMHHHLLWEGKWRPAGQWFPTRTLNRLAALGVELILNGHTHVPIARETPQGIVIAQCGTTMSSRTRHGHGNTYNRIEIAPGAITIHLHEYDSALDRFVPKMESTFARHPSRAANAVKVKKAQT